MQQFLKYKQPLSGSILWQRLFAVIGRGRILLRLSQAARLDIGLDMV